MIFFILFVRDSIDSDSSWTIPIFKFEILTAFKSWWLSIADGKGIITNPLLKLIASDSESAPALEIIKSDHNIIEANSDGVRTNPLDSYLNGYANRIIAFRPKLENEDIKIILKSLYSFLGFDYDFDFDLTSGEKQACSEIIYRSYNGMGNINIELEEVLGATTLSGDKLLNYFINDGESTLLFLAVENEARPNKAKIYEGTEAFEYIKANVSGVVKR